MGHRLSSIVTRTGDAGTTSIDGQVRVPKSTPEVAILGELDELGAQIGLAHSAINVAHHNGQTQNHPKWQAEMMTQLLAIQHDLFSVGGSVVMRAPLFDHALRVGQLEAQIEEWLQVLPPLKDFILAGGSPPSAQLHVCRAVCRRAERHWWACWPLTPFTPLTPSHKASKPMTIQTTPPAPEALIMGMGQYLNRLADWLFVAARLQNAINAHDEIIWKNPTR